MNQKSSNLSSLLCNQVGVVYRSHSLFFSRDELTRQIGDIQREVLAGTYHLSPRTLYVLTEEDIPNLPKDFGTLMKVDENCFMGIYMKPEEKLVLIALGEVLVQEFGQSSDFRSTISCQTKEEFISRILSMRGVESLYVI